VTTTTSPTDTDRRQLAELLLRRSGLTLVDGVDPDQLVGMLAKVLYQHHPSNTDHGRLLLIALIPREGPRSPAEVAVQKLVARGQAPTPVAVAGQVRTTEAAALAAAARKARLRPQVDQAGPAAALRA
jgi:hypothetical protein